MKRLRHEKCEYKSRYFTFQSDQQYNSSSLHSKLHQPRKHDSLEPSRTQQRGIQCDYQFIASLAYLPLCIEQIYADVR